MRFLIPSLLLFTLPLALCANDLQADLYRPAARSLDLNYPPAQVDEHTPLEPTLYIYGKDFRAGHGSFRYQILAGQRTLAQGTVPVDLKGQVLELAKTLDTPCPGADHVQWTLTAGDDHWQGSAPLTWSRFRGRIEFQDGRLRPSYINLHPKNFGHTFTVPVQPDGTFEAEVPARSYAVANINSAGYALDTLERWAWDYDLTRDREDLFRMGRTELYGMHAYQMNGGGRTVFLTFRPSCLTRMLQHRSSPQAKPKDEATMKAVMEHMRLDPMTLAPRLTRKDVKVWIDGRPCEPTDLTQLVETSPGGFFQTLYMLQFFPPENLARGTAYEIKVEVESKDVLDGQMYSDFGQGSCSLRIE